MSERERADTLLVADSFRPALEHYRAAVSGADSERAMIECEVEERLAQERTRIEQRLEVLTGLRDEVIAMADTVASHPDVAQLGGIGPAPPATVHEGSPDAALRAIHERIRARIAAELPGHAAAHADESNLAAGAARASTAGDAGAPPHDDDRRDHHAAADLDEDEDEDEALGDGPGTRSGCARWFGALAVSLVVLVIGAVVVNAIPGSGSGVGFLCSDPWVAVGTLLIECDAQDVPRQPAPEPPRPREPVDTSTQPPSECESGRWHRVRPGEGLKRIAAQHGTSQNELQALNSTKIVNPDHIEAGWLLCLPEPE